MSTTAKNTATSPWPSSRAAAWYVIGDPADNRVGFFRDACAGAGIEPRVIDYRELLVNPARLDDIPEGSIVRIESPGRAPDLHAAFRAHGGAARSELRRGEIALPTAWFNGFRDVLGLLRQRMDGRVRWTSHPDDVVCMFDKAACHERLERFGVPVPRALGRVESYERLIDRMAALGISRVFLKLRYGSSASGIVAYRKSGEREQAVTTVEAASDGLFNTRRIRRLRARAEIAGLIDRLCRCDVHVEEWVPKAGMHGRTFDLRVVVIGGRMRHTLMRLSRGPMTNLHLLNERRDTDALREQMGETWQALAETAGKVAGCFPCTLHFGLDVAVAPGLRSHRVLEVNAFGDLLKGALHEGRNTYESQLQAVGEGWFDA